MYSNNVTRVRVEYASKISNGLCVVTYRRIPSTRAYIFRLLTCTYKIPNVPTTELYGGWQSILRLSNTFGRKKKLLQKIALAPSGTENEEFFCIWFCQAKTLLLLEILFSKIFWICSHKKVWFYSEMKNPLGKDEFDFQKSLSRQTASSTITFQHFERK